MATKEEELHDEIQQMNLSLSQHGLNRAFLNIALKLRRATDDRL